MSWLRSSALTPEEYEELRKVLIRYLESSTILRGEVVIESFSEEVPFSDPSAMPYKRHVLTGEKRLQLDILTMGNENEKVKFEVKFKDKGKRKKVKYKVVDANDGGWPHIWTVQNSKGFTIGSFSSEHMAKRVASAMNKGG